MADKGMVEQSCSVAFADNECAQALLELAKSHSPPNGVCRPMVDNAAKESLFSVGSALYMNGATGAKNNKKGKSGKNSILKRHLEHAEKRTRRGAYEDYDPSLYVKTDCRSPEELRVELVKRIHLDHSYPCSGDVSWNRYVKSLSHFGAEFPGKTSAKITDGRCRQPTGLPAGFVPSKTKRYSPENKHTATRSPTRGFGSWKNRESPNSNNYDLCDVKEEAPMKEGPCTSLWQHGIPIPQETREKENIVDPHISPSNDLYQPNDSKYKNFNLLLKCLTNDDASDDKMSGRERCDSTKSGSINDLSGSSEDGNPMINLETAMETAEYQCFFCPRMFQQKRYMTKHLKRLHAEMLKEEMKKKNDNIICPYCGRSILRQNFKQHTYVCNCYTKKSKKQLEMDLANCQFCGIRMRRHILVKHLAQAHCVENAHGASLFFLDDDDHSDSSTLSGSEREGDDIDHKNSEPKACGDSQPNQDSVSWRSDTTHQNSPPAETVPMLTEPVKLPSPVPTTSDDYTNCPVCGCLVVKKKLMSHIDSEHRINPPAAQDAKPTPAESSLQFANSTCSHSMLQRFLSENSDQVAHTDSGSTAPEECHSCVQRLVSQTQNADDGYVSSNNNYALQQQMTGALTKPIGTSTLTNAAYTIYISKDTQLANSVPSLPSTQSVLKTDLTG